MATTSIFRTGQGRDSARGRPRRRGWRWAAVALIIAALTVGGLLTWQKFANAAPPASTVSVPVTQGDIDVVVSGSGNAQPAQNVNVSFQTSGLVQQVLVKPGDRVNVGQPLARLADSDLRLSVEQAQANLTSAQAALEKLQAGATAKQLTDAQSALDAAKAAYDKVKTGNYSASDIADAKAQLDAAKLKLAQLNAGPTQADIANARAAITSAQARLQQAQHGNATAADLAAAKSQLDQARVHLQQATSGNATAAAIASAQAQLDAANTKLAQVQMGATAAQQSAAHLKVTDAQTNLDKTTSQEQASVNAALAARNQADNAVRKGQDDLTTVYQQTHDANGNLRQDPPGQPGYMQRQNDQAQRNLADAYSSQTAAAASYDNALVQQHNNMAAAQAALSDARKQLADTLNPPTHEADLASAQSAVQQAQANLDALTKGGSASDVQLAQLAVDQAQASYDKLTTGSTATDIRVAQAALDQAQASYDKLVSPPTPDLISADQAAIATAQANYDKMMKGGSPDDLTQAQATVTQALAALDELKAGPLKEDVAAAQAAVTQAQTQLDQANLKLVQATLTAPLTGTIGTVSAIVGSNLGGSATAVTIVDTTTMHIDVSLSENDVAAIKLGQSVNVSFDALPKTAFTGTVISIAPTGTTQNNIVNYLVQIGFNPGNSGVKVGMSATANIVTEHHAAVIEVPSRAVTTQGQLSTVQVLYGSNQSPVTVAVQTGASDGTMTEIVGCVKTQTQCLRTGDKVSINLPTTSGSAGGSAPNAGYAVIGSSSDRGSGGPVQIIQKGP